jgi:acetoacetyl-CoA synthetase
MLLSNPAFYHTDVWTHGDFILIHPVTRQIFFLGRADGVLNPSGVRFGSAEIYNVIEAFFSSSVADSICVGQRRPQDPDETVMLFLMMKAGVSFSAGLVNEVKAAIRRELSARHVPKYVFETPEIPVCIRSFLCCPSFLPLCALWKREREAVADKECGRLRST